MSKLSILLATSLSLMSLSVSAVCEKAPGFVRTEEDSLGTGLALGRINVTSSQIQPAGTVLASSVVRFSDNPLYRGPDQVLWVCDLSDANNIFEIIATNGDDRNSGFWDLGAEEGIPNVFATYFKYVGLRLTHVNSGLVFTRNYQRIPMKNYGLSDDGTKIHIRVKDFSPVRAEAIRISKNTTDGAPGNACGQITSGSYSACVQPNGYVSFCSPGSKGDEAYCDSGDSSTSYVGWWKDNWMALNMGMAPASTLTTTATCVAKSVTPVVIFPKISRAELENGNKARASFTVTVSCENTATSGVMQNQTAMGLQVSYESYLAAQTLNLVNGSGGVSHLLSGRYGDADIARGVGIQIANASDDVVRQFIGWGRCTDTSCATGASGGWYPVTDGATSISNVDGISDYLINFNAYLVKIPGETVTPGKVDAQADVWVKLQ
ncbi:TPA: fimbrial protein [Citrobacter freundii]